MWKRGTGLWFGHKQLGRNPYQTALSNSKWGHLCTGNRRRDLGTAEFKKGKKFKMEKGKQGSAARAKERRGPIKEI